MSSTRSVMSKSKRKRSIRQQIRDNKRLLAKEDLPETVRETKSRVLSMLLEEEYRRQKECKEKKINKKYKMVKFFEKRKVCRRLKTLLDEFASNPESTIDEIQQLRGDLNYITYYPLSEKYFSLYPKTKTSQLSLSRRECLYQEILKDVENGVHKDGLQSVCSINIYKTLPSIDATVLPLCEEEGLSIDGAKGNKDTEECTGGKRRNKNNGDDLRKLTNERTLKLSKKVHVSSKRKTSNDCMIKNKVMATTVTACDEEGNPKKLKNDSFFL